MRIVIDIQGGQGESRFRGIGRYSVSLAQAMAREATSRGHDVRLALSSQFPDTIPLIRQAFQGILSQESLSVFSVPGDSTEMFPNNAWRARIAEQVREQFMAQLKPDFVHVASLFEGWVDNTVTSVRASSLQIPTAVTLYDLIPLVLKEIYLVDPGYKAYYLRKLESLKRSELLLAISAYSRKEAIDVLGFDANRIANISSAVDATFCPVVLSPEDSCKLLSKYQITRRFVLYVPGGFDPRKNFNRLIEAFARLPQNVRKDYQLVIASMVPEYARTELEHCAEVNGLEPDALVLTGYVSDDELRAFYSLCKLFVLPSLHEGFGLPALEAMTCGAPVIGSNATGIPEVIGREDALFDPVSISSISQLLNRGLTDEGFERSLRQHAIIQSRKFSWAQSAKQAVDAIEEQHEKRAAGKDAERVPETLEEIYETVLAEIDQKALQCAATEHDLILLKNALSDNLQALRQVSQAG